MSKFNISPAALEAGARAAMKDNGCGYTANGQHVLCDDPALDGVIDAYGKPMRDLNCSCRSMARAAFVAMVAAWPGMHTHEWQRPWLGGMSGIDLILPLPQEGGDE